MEPLAELMFAMSRQLAKGPVIWGGHSWGGKLAAIVAALHPQATEALLLLDPSPASGMPVPAETFVDMTFGGELGPWRSLAEARSSVRNLPQYSNWNMDLERAFERGLACGADGTIRARISRETLIAICSAVLKDHSATIRRVSCPAMFAVADESLFWQEQTNFPLLPHAARAVIRSNHWLMTGNPAELNLAVADWLSALGEQGLREAR
jgi:pimeloyl-ACP methyl ester carboxylesterase